MSDETPVATAPVTEIPAFRDAENKLRHLKPKDFPRTREGRRAFYGFKAEVFTQLARDWQQRAIDIDKADDPAFQKAQRVEKLKAQLAKLEAELSA
jgi:threonyl-tRNA synthetase